MPCKSPGSISNAADPWGDIMKFIIEVEFPLEPFNTHVRQGTIGEKIGEVQPKRA